MGVCMHLVARLLAQVHLVLQTIPEVLLMGLRSLKGAIGSDHVL